MPILHTHGSRRLRLTYLYSASSGNTKKFETLAAWRLFLINLLCLFTKNYV